jgi:hypothetical protein
MNQPRVSCVNIVDDLVQVSYAFKLEGRSTASNLATTTAGNRLNTHMHVSDDWQMDTDLAQMEDYDASEPTSVHPNCERCVWKESQLKVVLTIV